MLRFIWDKVRKVLPISLLLAALGIVFYIMMKHAGEDVAALLGLFDIGVALLLIGMMVCGAVRDLLRWRRDFDVASALDDYREAEQVHPNARLGRERVFFNRVALEYRAIQSMHCTYEHTAFLRGHVTWWYMLYAVRADGKKFRVLLVQEKKNQDSKGKATALFSRIMDAVRAHNPQADLRYPAY